LKLFWLLVSGGGSRFDSHGDCSEGVMSANGGTKTSSLKLPEAEKLKSWSNENARSFFSDD
jgi:hypothetical protein